MLAKRDKERLIKLKEKEKLNRLEKFSKKHKVPIEFLKEEDIEIDYGNAYEYRWQLIDTRTNEVLEIA